MSRQQKILRRKQWALMKNFPKGMIVRHKRTKLLYRVKGVEWRSDRLVVETLKGVADLIWWRRVESVHPLIALASIAPEEMT